MLTFRIVLRRALLPAFGAALFGLSPAPSAATSPPLPFDPLVRGPLLGEPAHAEEIGDPDRTAFPANLAFLAPVTLYASTGMELFVEAHPSLPNAWRPTLPLAAGAYTFAGGTTYTAGMLESTGGVDDLPPATPQIVSITSVIYSSSGGCSRNEGHAYSEAVEIEFDSIADDATPRARITLAIYAGHSAGEAQTMSEPTLVAIEDSRWFQYDITTTGYTHFAVAALDLAGNASPRSASFEYVPDE